MPTNIGPSNGGVVLYCTVLYCTVLYCTVLYCIVLYCNVHFSKNIAGLYTAFYLKMLPSDVSQ